MRKAARVSVAALALGGISFVAGCQNSGHADNTTVRTASATTDYDQPYVAARDTEWMSTPNGANAERGAIARGTHVFLNNAPSTSGLQPARVEGHEGVVYVRGADLRQQ